MAYSKNNKSTKLGRPKEKNHHKRKLDFLNEQKGERTSKNKNKEEEKTDWEAA
jgi:hypothetical protein